MRSRDLEVSEMLRGMVLDRGPCGGVAPLMLYVLLCHGGVATAEWGARC
jgi:hypothetical protein